MNTIVVLLIIQTIVFYGLFFVSGLLLYFFPPKKNKWYGFRTNKALLNKENWEFAQKISSKTMLIITPILFVFSILIKFFSQFNYSALGLYTIIDVLLLIIGTVMIYFITEDKLKKYNK